MSRFITLSGPQHSPYDGEDLAYLGVAPVRTRADGRVVFRRSELRFAPQFGAAGPHDYMGDDMDDDMDDYMDDDMDDYMDDFGLVEAEGDEDDFGRRRRRRRRRGRRGGGRARGGRVMTAPMQATVVAGRSAESGTAIGAATVVLSRSITITPQHPFRAKDLTLVASPAIGADWDADVTRSATLNSVVVTSIFFGDDLIWQSSAGVPAQAFDATGYLRSLLEGAKLSPGLSIVVNVNLSFTGDNAASVATGVVDVAITGEKPGKNC